MRPFRSLAVYVLCGANAAALAGAAAAQAPEIRFARQFSMGYLQFNLMEHHKLWRSTPRPRACPRSRWRGPPSTARRR